MTAPVRKKTSHTGEDTTVKGVKMAAVTTTPVATRRRSSLPGRTPATPGGRTPVPTTPFRTPRRIPLRQTPAAEVKETEDRFKANAEEWKSDLKALLNKTMKICNLSSMNGFFFNNKAFRRKYEKELKHKIYDAYPSPVLTVSLATSSCLTYDPKTVDAVRITVTSIITADNPDDDRIATVYTAWLYLSDTVQTIKLKNIWFPVMIFTGREIIHQVVVDWLQGAFGCYVAKNGIRRSDLLWIIGVWSGRYCPLPSHAKDTDFQVSLTYSIHTPSSHKRLSFPNNRGKPRLILRIPLKDIRHIWETIVDVSENEMSLSQLRQFFDCMDRLAGTLLCLPTSCITLINLTTPCMALDANGKVRLTCRRSAGFVLGHLSEIFLKTTNSSAFQDYMKDPLIDGVGYDESMVADDDDDETEEDTDDFDDGEEE